MKNFRIQNYIIFSMIEQKEFIMIEQEEINTPEQEAKQFEKNYRIGQKILKFNTDYKTKNQKFLDSIDTEYNIQSLDFFTRWPNFGRFVSGKYMDWENDIENQKIKLDEVNYNKLSKDKQKKIKEIQQETNSFLDNLLLNDLKEKKILFHGLICFSIINIPLYG